MSETTDRCRHWPDCSIHRGRREDRSTLRSLSDVDLVERARIVAALAGGDRQATVAARHNLHRDVLHRLVNAPHPLWVARAYGVPRPSDVVIRNCGHGIPALRNGDHWLHPMTLTRCDEPPEES